MELSGDAPVPVAANQNYIGVRLGHARSHRAHTRLGYQLHRDASLRVNIFQVVNQLCEIFDRVNVMVRRRRNQSDPGD